MFWVAPNVEYFRLKVLQMSQFIDFQLPSSLMGAITAKGFTTPTPIQQMAVPKAISGLDLIGLAQTGTGKTAAFLIPALKRILDKEIERALVLAPTRELAIQILDVLKELTVNDHHIKSALLIGGASMGFQMRSLDRRPRVVIATPGRLIDHLERGSLSLDTFGFVVLDEADRMLDMGFAPQVERVFKSLPDKRQTLLFSATFPKTLMKMAEKYMNSPERISVLPKEQALSKLKQTPIMIDGAKKNDAVLELLKARSGLTIIFARTQIRTDRLMRFLKAGGIKAVGIHGGRTQGQRRDALERFKDGSYPVMVATDVAARGLDIPAIELVINFDLPQTPEDYIHRIGRTARAGAEGEAISYVTPDEERHWKMIQRVVSGDKESQSDGGRPAIRGGRFKGPRRGGNRFAKNRSFRGGGERRPQQRQEAAGTDSKPAKSRRWFFARKQA